MFRYHESKGKGNYQGREFMSNNAHPLYTPAVSELTIFGVSYHSTLEMNLKIRI